MSFLKSFIQIWGHIYQFLPNEYVCYRNATGKNPPSENDTAEWLVWSGRCVNIAAQSHCHNACCAKHHCGQEFSSGSEHLNSQYFLLCVFE